MPSAKTTKPKRKPGRPRTKPQRPNPSETTKEDLLVSLELIAESRLEALNDTHALRQEEELRHASILHEIWILHRKANQAFIEAIDAAHARGVPKGAIYDRIGLSSVRVNQIRRWCIETEQADKK